MIGVKEFRCPGTVLFDSDLPEKAMYEILIYQWCANTLKTEIIGNGPKRSRISPLDEGEKTQRERPFSSRVRQ